MRKHFLPFALPAISEQAIEEVVSVLRSGWVTSGPKVVEFEEKFLQYIGSDHAIALNSATAGLHLCLEAIGMTGQDAAIVPSVTFTATAEVVCYFGATPLLTDVDPENNLLTPEILDDFLQRECDLSGKYPVHKKTQKSIKAVLPVHLAGYTCDMAGILTVAKKHELYVIEDAAHAFPAIHRGLKIGNWGDFTVFSFYATKGITTGEGGMVTTNHKSFADRIRLMRLHGIDKTAFDRRGWHYQVVEAGYKYNLTDIAAALGLVQLAEAEQLWQRRKQIAFSYLSAFADIPGLKLPTQDANGVHSWHLFRVQIEAGRDRDEVALALKEKKIGTSLHFIPLFEHPYYQNKFSLQKQDYPHSCDMYQKTLSLPIYPLMSDEDIADVIHAMKLIFKT